MTVDSLGRRGLLGSVLVHTNGSNGARIYAMSLAGLTFPQDGYLVIGDGGVNSLGADWNTSIGRVPDRVDTDDNATDFPAALFPSPSRANLPRQPDPDVYTRLSGAGRGDASAYLAPIPDADPTEISLIVPNPGFVEGPIVDVQVALHLRHPWRSDLIVEATSPGGTTVRMHDRTGGNGDDIVTLYDTFRDPDGPGTLDDLDGELLEGAASGSWTLAVSDNAAGEVGVLVDWVVFIGTAPLPAVHDVTIFNFDMSPDPVTISAGDTVRWTNNDQTIHTVTSGDPGDPDAGTLFDSGALVPGDTFEFTFDAPGTYRYHCVPHQGTMFGFEVVVQ